MKDLATHVYITYLHDILKKQEEASRTKDQLIELLEKQVADLTHTVGIYSQSLDRVRLDRKLSDLSSTKRTA